jgi:arylsulfatase A-like enzyme
MGRIVLLLTTLLTAMVLASAGIPEAQTAPAEQPNILVIGTDDNSEAVLERAMDNVNTRVGQAGVAFENFTYAQSLCCPNRAATQRGQYPHNTGVLGNDPPNGGYETFRARGLQQNTLGRTVDEAGYSTAYVGKYMNGYEKSLGSVPTGWDSWLSGAPMGDCYSANGEKKCPPDYDSWAHDRWATEKAKDTITKWPATGQPDMLFVSLYNPHSPWEHPDRYDSKFQDAVPPSLAFAESDVSDKPPHIRNNANGPRARSTWIKEYRQKLRSAAYTDDLIGGVLDKLTATGELQNTYVIYWNDNGYQVGEHRLSKKNHPYLESERFPLYVRGPGIDAGTKSEEMVGTVDIRPTLEDMAGASAATPSFVDGESFLPLAKGDELAAAGWRDYAYAEMLKTGGGQPRWRAAYTPESAYHEWIGNNGAVIYREFYGLQFDPHELDGTIDTDEEPLVPDHQRAIAEFKDCRAQECRDAGKGIGSSTALSGEPSGTSSANTATFDG